MSERLACRVVKQPRGTQRYRPTQRDDEDALTQAIVTLATQYGRYGYRRITALLKRTGWRVGKDRVERIWRREGLKVPQKQKPRGRLWLNDGSCVRLRPEHTNHVWSYDFVSAKTHDGRTVRILNLIDEHTRESLLVRPERRWSSARVIEALADVMVMKGVPEHIRSDSGPEFVAKDLRKWLADTGAKTLYIEPGSRQRVMHARAGVKVLALGLCATCYTLKGQDEEHFGGLREAVLERDGYRCRVCA